MNNLFTHTKLPCTWDESIMCEHEKLCDGCEHQPPDDEKVNDRNPPVKLIWDEQYGMVVPLCPSCREIPYSAERCVFCGQRFVQDAATDAWKEPPKEERMDCFMCGGKNTLVGHRARVNGHFHGKCEQCGCKIME